MKTKLLLLAGLVLMSIVLVGCKKDKNVSSNNELTSTVWKGALENINIEISYLEDNACYIRLTGQVIATAKGTYKTSNSTVYMTVTNLTGDFGGNLKVGDVVSATYDLQKKTMVFYLPIDGSPRSIELIQS